MKSPLVESASDVVAVAVEGSAVEGRMVEMTALPAKGRFVAYLRLSPGNFSFSATLAEGEHCRLGKGHTEGVFAKDGVAITTTKEQIVRLIVDINNNAYEVTPIESLNVKGSIVEGDVPLNYAGRGVWRSRVELPLKGGNQYIDRNIYFAFNDVDSLALKRIPGSNKIGLEVDGINGEPIRLNPGDYTISVDMREGRFNIARDVDPFRVSVFGSSVANGQGAGDFRGYAYLYGEQLKQRCASGASSNPLYTAGVSIGGNTTTNLLNRYDDMTRDFGKYVIIGLSLGNEGIHGAANQQRVFDGFRTNMLRLIAAIRADGKTPVVVNNYTRSDYDESDYSCVKKMNLLIHEWDVASINSLGSIDDGSGKWAEGYIDDAFHPNTAGHQEFMHAFVPSLFDALVEGKPQPVRKTDASLPLGGNTLVQFTPEERVHPFTVAVRVKGSQAGRILQFACSEGDGIISITEDGNIVYLSPENKEYKSSAAINSSDWHDIALTHYYARGYTSLFVDGMNVAEANERMTLDKIVFGDSNSEACRDFSEIFFWRSGMNAEEMDLHHQGRMLKSSLELYSPMLLEDDSIPNRAQSLNYCSMLIP